MTTPLTATLEQTGDGPADEHPVQLRITNAADAPVELTNPDLGRPTAEMEWPYSLEAYRASLLVSFGFLKLDVTGESGEHLEQAPPQTLATPALRTPVALSPGESLDVQIPVGIFFTLTPGQSYRLSAEYGDDKVKVRAEGEITPG
jgi:hypothetical protein